MPDGPGSGLVVDHPGAPAAAGRRVGHGDDGLGPQPGVADHPALADPVLADLELRLHHQRQVGVRGADPEQGVQHELQGDERQVADDDVDRVRRSARG